MAPNRRNLTVEVLRVRGPLSVEDAGRPRQLSVGVPLGGYADRPAAQLANRLVGNLDSAPLLEVALAAPRLRFSHGATIACTGAAVRWTVNGLPVPDWTRVQVGAGDVVDGGGVGERGLFGYLAIGGRWTVRRWRGSVSPLRLGAEVWPRSSSLAAGDELSIEPGVRAGKVWARPVAPWWAREPIRLRFGDAPESALVGEVVGTSAERFDQLASTRWRVVRRASNRMGVRLAGGPRWFEPPSAAAERWSGAVLPGVVQWLAGGDLIVAGVDCQTIGGYPRIGWVD